MPNPTGEVPICEPDGKGLVLPLFREWELSLSDPVRALLYFLGLVYFFLGVTFVADRFMSAIETITSKKKRIYDKEKGRWRTVKIWNDTVANLTLMALGSSAPEILLNVIEVGKRKCFEGDLGPGTIVGSAAFNLLGITAVCIYAIESPDVRYIRDTNVYTVTAVFSLLAYFWVLVVLKISTPNEVTLLEAIVTFMAFPLLVLIAWCADKGFLGGQPTTASNVVAAELSKEELAEVIKSIKDQFGDLDDDTVTLLVERQTAAKATRARYMVESCRLLRRHKTNSCASSGAFQRVSKENTNVTFPPATERDRETTNPVVGGQTTMDFAMSHYAVCENAGKVSLEVRRYDEGTSTAWVKYRTVEGTAKARNDYVHAEGVLEFGPGVASREIEVQIVDDTEWEAAEDFYVELLEPTCSPPDCHKGLNYSACLGNVSTATVTIIDDDDPGTLCFDQDFVCFEESLKDETCYVKVTRKQGSRGTVSCKCRTEDHSAVAPLDFEAIDEELVFKEGQITCDIPLVIKARGRFESTERFRIVLYDPVGCRFDKNTDGDAEEDICWVEIKASETHRDTVERLAKVLSLNWDKARLGGSNWKDQFTGALYAGGLPDEGQEAPSVIDWIIHLVILPWKLILACIPPPDLGEGWCSFFASLLGIAGITALIGDLAELLGCVLGLPPAVTSITFVALGTSLPDTFASMTAARQDMYADASIGNITGSNSVNVFLGLGLPWAIAAIYWELNHQTPEWKDKYPDLILKHKKGGYIVTKGGDLAFSVGIFVGCAACCMLCLFIRRKLFHGELGGPFVPKVVSAVFLSMLWFGYIAASWVYIKMHGNV